MSEKTDSMKENTKGENLSGSGWMFKYKRCICKMDNHADIYNIGVWVFILTWANLRMIGVKEISGDRYTKG